jgi:hypothetical protein
MGNIPDDAGCHAPWAGLMIYIMVNGICRYLPAMKELYRSLQRILLIFFLIVNANRIQEKRVKDLPVFQNSILYERI